MQEQAVDEISTVAVLGIDYARAVEQVVGGLSAVAEYADTNDIYDIYDCGYPFEISFDELVVELYNLRSMHSGVRYNATYERLTPKSATLHYLADALDGLELICSDAQMSSHFRKNMPKIFSQKNGARQFRQAIVEWMTNIERTYLQ